MNRFIKARNSCVKNYNSDMGLSFNEYYLLYNNNSDLYGQNTLINQLANIRTLLQKSNSTDMELDYWFAQLGINPYLNRAIIDLLIQNRKHKVLESLEQQIQQKLLQDGQDHMILFHLLDYCIETKAKLLDVQQVKNLFQTYRYDYDVLKQLVDYVNFFHYQELENILEELLEAPYYENLKLLVIDTLINLQDSRDKKTMVISRLRSLVANEHNHQVFNDYFDYSLENISKPEKSDKLTIVQTMFYGDPYTAGMGSSGGLGIILKNIGNQLETSNDVDKIITLTVSRKWNHGWKLVEKAAPKHYVFRMPINLDPNNPADFATKELVIKRTIKKSMKLLGLYPDIYHIRYLDNASLAVAKAALEQKSHLVFTITPDPHRNMFENTGSLKSFTASEALTLSNKIYIGDKILTMADGVMGIGGAKVRN